MDAKKLFKRNVIKKKKNTKEREDDSTRTSRGNSHSVVKITAGIIRRVFEITMHSFSYESFRNKPCIASARNIIRKGLFQGLKAKSLSKYSSTF